ncbi:MAG: DedA family protein [Gemmatimonadetes bacterium]|nr:DedA family protein [Gemmatimonadota bacterium]
MLTLPPGAVYFVVGVLAAVENVFPPVPADTAVAIGAFASTGGGVSAPVVFIITWVANVASAAGVYLAARRLGRPFFQSRLGQRLMRPRALSRLERIYAEHGTWGIFLSRFIPGVRAVVPPFAGVAGLGALRTLVPAALASGIWYGLLVYLVSRFAGEISNVVRWVDRLNVWALGIALGIAAALIVVFLVRRRSDRRTVGDS